MKNNLKKYLSLSSAFVAVGVSANAQVVYTDVNPDLAVPGNNDHADSFYDIDIDNDSNIDFQLGLHNVNDTVIQSTGGQLITSFGAVWIIGNQPLNQAIYSFTTNTGSNTNLFAQPFDAGNIVSAGAGNFGSWGYLGVQSYWLFTDSTRNIPGGKGDLGNFPDAGDKHIAIQFSPNGTDVHYGWIRVNVNAKNRGFTLRDYAYNATPNAPITIGDLCSTVTIQDSVSSCDSAVVNGKAYFTSQTVTDTLVSQYGCDSIVNTEVTILPNTIAGTLSDTTNIIEFNDLQIINNSTNATSVQWQVNTGGGFVNITDGDGYTGGTYSGATTDTLSMNNVFSANTGNLYRVVAVGLCSTDTTNYTFLNVNAGTPGASYLKAPYDGKTNVQTWGTFYVQSISGASQYTMQVSEDSSFESVDYTFSSSNNKFSVSNLLYNKVYYARVLTDLDETYGASSSFTTTPVPITRLTSPANGATNLELGDFANCSFPDTDVDQIIYEFNTDPGFSAGSAIFDTNTAVASNVSNRSSRSYSDIGLSTGVTYYVRVKSNATSHSAFGGFSSSRSFEIAGTDVLSSMTSPADASVDIRTFPKIYFKEIAGATSYTVDLSTDSNFGTIDFSETVTTYKGIQFSGLSYNSTYYVRVQADGGSYGETKSFTTVATPVCYIGNISDGATGITLTKRLYVNWQDTGVDEIIYELNTDPGFGTGTAIMDTSYGGSRISKTFSDLGLAGSTTYYARVKSNATGLGVFGTYSSSISFTTVASRPQARVSANTINDNSVFATKFDVFPNPFSNILNIKVESEKQEKLNVRVSDLSGKIVYESNNHQTNQSIQIGEELVQGMYLVQLTFGDETKLIKVVKK